MAVSAFEIPSTTRMPTSSPGRGQRLVSAVSGVLVTTTVKANTVTSSPIWASLTPREALISGSRPVGIISLVTERKVAAARAIKPVHGNFGARGTGVVEVVVIQVCPTDGAPQPFRRDERRPGIPGEWRVDYALMCAPRAEREPPTT